MKKIYLFCVMAIMGITGFAQRNINLNIQHYLNASPFAFGAASTNDLGNGFSVRRLEYYIAEITLIHDGAQETTVPDTWILVDASQPVAAALGSYSVTNLEAIRFGIGVQAAYNHLDPSTYASQHPLSPKSPSMHWGWSSGYRFVAMEGNSGTNLSQTFEIHALEDVNYFQTTVTTTGTTNGQDLDINLQADYTQALKGIDVSAGPIVHGGSGDAITLLQNFRDFVFSPALATALDPSQTATTFSMAPNPAAQSTRLLVNTSLGHETAFLVYDCTGKLLRTLHPIGGAAELQIDQAGFYLVSLQSHGKTLSTKRLVITQ